MRTRSRLAAWLTLAIVAAVLAACGGQPPLAEEFTLTVTVAGTGTGTVTSDPAGISVTSGEDPAEAQFAEATEVVLTATPDTGYSFEGWTGACTGTGTCTVTMDEDAFVTATFSESAPDDFDLTVTVAGSGTGSVTSAPAGISLATGDEPATATFVGGTDVVLTATPADGSQFLGWSGDCAGTGTCTVTMDEDATVTATFVPFGTILHTLTVEFYGNGDGAVVSDPAGIDLTATGSFDFVQGTQVTLTATPEAGSFFVGWGGACSGTGDCVVDVDDALTVTAEFALDTDVVSDTFAILSGNDDAEEFEDFVNDFFPAGSVQLDSNDLDLTFDTAGGGRGRVTVGLRYADVTIPQGAVIRSASITFTTIGTAGNVTLDIEAQAADDAPAFEGGRIDENPGTELNISGRARTTANVSWASDSAWEVTAATPDLSAIVQEIVGRGGWSSGNALAFIIQSPDSDADNRRTAHAYESNPSLAPSLTISYYVPTAP
jgi:uncharacterized repeat protein (TIGR02543 family)